MYLTAQDLREVKYLKIIADKAKSRRPIPKVEIIKVDKDKLPIN